MILQTVQRYLYGLLKYITLNIVLTLLYEKIIAFKIKRNKLKLNIIFIVILVIFFIAMINIFFVRIMILYNSIALVVLILIRKSFKASPR